MAAATQVDRLRAGKILNPEMVIEEAKREGLRLSLACAILEKESSGGQNVFGHDRDTIFAGAGAVTREKYLDYKRQRDAQRGRHRMQGVGPAQLTWWEWQNEADAEGGCWQPRFNIRIGFRNLVKLMRAHGEPDGIRRYNGTGDAAEAYSRDIRARARRWHQTLSGARPPAPATSLRRGDTGKAVLILTRRLSFVRAAKTHKGYLDGKRTTFDAETELALKRFQRQHGLKGTGVASAETLRTLDRATRAEKARRKRPVPTPGTPARKPKPALAELVNHYERRAALSDRAWAELLAYGGRLREVLEHEKAHPSHPSPNGGGSDALADALARIEAKLGILITIEERQTELLTGGPRPPVIDVTPTPPVIDAGVPAGSVATATAPAEAPVATAPVAPPKRRALTELDHAELVGRIALLDRMAHRARAELIERYEDAESELATLRPRRTKVPAVRDKMRRPEHGGNGSGKLPTKPTPDRKPDPGPAQGGRSVVAKRGDTGVFVRRSKLALARYLKGQGDPDLALRKQLRRDARAPGRRNLATGVWEKGVRAAQRVAGQRVDGQLDGELMRLLQPLWPTDSAAKRAVRSTPAWRTIPGQLTPNFNVKEFACKDRGHTTYIAGLMREQGLSRKEAKLRAKGLAKRLEHLRKLDGGKRLVITSAYRSKPYNKSVGGEPNSAHLRGYAVDVQPPSGVSLDRHHENAKKAFECGIGYYAKGRGYFIHCDFDHTLGKRRTWRG
ncbi:D-Ala-D-Ala carboxypeptidase family metallohydrolase [Solirubrobacter phytolaccae]|uniref:D-Ala-D-Ala carboxypeptidase family metallohydrolase n=1 Tax=Solirubrobacter phytolaccae TaxID=1404360 RepID=A0A9X3N3E9_9ACTN|nr:D-Ala-D-Ala carboxypeptidase family metallohydrolase [Solirubrobacter phytolaccae]MDA0178741.1 D-Ala-D-Ala carboxypeptidase family metallohydrolase [Solirubrobacter phytolaccae]